VVVRAQAKISKGQDMSYEEVEEEVLKEHGVDHLQKAILTVPPLSSATEEQHFQWFVVKCLLETSCDDGPWRHNRQSLR